MTEHQIFNQLIELILTVKPKTDTSKITLESALVRDLGVDSLSMLLLSLAIENRFNIKFDDNITFNTVSEVIDYISSRLLD